MSPHKDSKKGPDNNKIVDRDDQMFKISERIDINPSKDLSFLHQDNQVRFVEDIIREGGLQKGKSIRDRFPYSSDELVNILEQMLSFNPHFRPTIKEI